MSAAIVLPPWLARAIEALRAGDVGGWMEIYAPDAVHEFPFAPEGMPRRLVGRDAIASYMGELPNMIRFGFVEALSVRETGDELVVEATGHHRSMPDDLPRTLDYVWFITRRDGRVTRIRDYMNPLQLAPK